jgi:Multiple myeloma tumor-associated
MSRAGDLYGPPIREASVRGGSGRFNWEDVKKDEKFRDTYIGHSLHAPVGRWQKGKDLQWYAKTTPTTAAAAAAAQKAEREAEIRKIKEAEEEALAEALGFKVERKVKNEGVSQEELANALKDEEVVEGGEGLGYGRYVSVNVEDADGSVKPRIGSTLPDGSVMMDHVPPETRENEVSVDVDIAMKYEKEGSVEREDRERKKHRHRHRRHGDDEERSRHKHRHHRREGERRHRSRSPRGSDKERHSERKHDRDRQDDSDKPRRRDYRERDDSPRREDKERHHDQERSPYQRERRHG